MIGRSDRKKMTDVDTSGMDAGGEERTRRVAAPSAISFGSISPAVIAPVKMSPSSRTQQKFVWVLDDVPDLPEFHVLERTAVFVPNSSPSCVAKRISDVLRDRSIQAVFEDDKAKVKCITEDGVDFRVRLYRGLGKFSHGIIVEVQRRFGASLDFRGVTMAILDSAEGKAVPPPGSSCLPLVSDSEDDSYETDGVSSLNMVSKMLSHPGHDATNVAMQTLACLTDPSKVEIATARKVSEALLADSDVWGKVLSLILDKNSEDDDLFMLRTAAMGVLANVLRNVQGRIPTMLREQLHPSLVRDLCSADKNPRLAVQAARCVEMLLTGDEQSDADLHHALTVAVEAGASRYVALERQAQLCLAKIT
jgi:hypothetical protein